MYKLYKHIILQIKHGSLVIGGSWTMAGSLRLKDAVEAALAQDELDASPRSRRRRGMKTNQHPPQDQQNCFKAKSCRSHAPAYLIATTNVQCTTVDHNQIIFDT